MRETMRKRPNRRTSEAREAQQAALRELEERIDALTTELSSAGSPYVAVPLEDQLASAIGRIDAELAAKR
jgi:hypothetical protein